MTCIIGYVNDEAMYMAGDRAASGYSNLVIVSSPKVFKINNVLFGYTASFRQGQVIKNFLKFKERGEHQDLEEYLFTEIVDNIIKVLEKNNCLGESTNKHKDGPNMLIAIEGRLFELQSDFSLLETNNTNLASVGSGEYLAMGAMEILDEQDIPIKTKLKKALKTVTKFNRTVMPPYDVISVKN